MTSIQDTRRRVASPANPTQNQALCLLGILSILGICAATAVPAQQATRKIVKDAVACKDKSVRERLTTLRLSGDRTAFERLGSAALATGAYRELLAGLTVYLEVGSMFDYVCLRPAGESQCYWTFPEAIK